MNTRTVDVKQSIDWVTILLVIAIMVCGWFSICGASSMDLDWASLLSFSSRPGKQLVWMGLGVLLASVMMLVPSSVMNTYAYVIYAAVIVLLLVTLAIAGDTKGSRSWLYIGSMGLQPAEFAKFATALALARFLDRFDFSVQRFKDLAHASALFFVPMLIIVLQNETGSAIVYLAFFLVMYREGMTGDILLLGALAILFFIIGLKYHDYTYEGQVFSVGRWVVLTIIQLVLSYKVWKNTGNLSILGIVSGIGIGGMLVALMVSMTVIPFNIIPVQLVLQLAVCIYLGVVAFKGMMLKLLMYASAALAFVGYLYSVDIVFDKLQPHQKTRINVILGLEDDPKGASYNVNQSMIAIGSGGVKGKGFRQGTQTKLKYVPEQDTDFIFCTVGEEQGFLGSTLVLGLYLALLLRLIVLSERQHSVFGRVYGYSVFSILLFHLFINVGMVLGITPVIGIPLPFFSYGGSSLWGFILLLSVFLRIDCERSTQYS